jgi:DSF synthase
VTSQHKKKHTRSETENLLVEYEPEYSAVWVKFRHPGRPSFAPGLLGDLSVAQKEILSRARQGHDVGDPNRLKYQVVASDLPGVFCLGGDLARFVHLIREGNREALLEYGKACIDILYPSAMGYDLPFTTISLVQGETLGGGFEAALSARMLVAEKSAKFGFPETIFGLFPGMGAFSLLARKLTPAMAKRIIVSGKVYTAGELYDMGVVDLLAEDGQGEKAVRDYILQQKNRSLGLQGLERVIDQFNPLGYRELYDAVEVWVDTAMQLSDKNLRLMDYLRQAQDKRWVNSRQPDEGEQLTPRYATA